MAVRNFREEAQPTPKIDEQFWYDLSAEWVKEAFKRIDSRASNLRNAINWFFGLGASGSLATIYFEISSFSNEANFILLAIPIVLFFAGYAFAVMTQTTSYLGEFYAESYTTIRDSFNAVVKRSKNFILYGSVCAFLGFISFPIILFSQLAKKETELAKSPSVYLISGYNLHDGCINQVSTTGFVGDSKDYFISISVGENFGNRAQIVDRVLYSADSTGYFSHNHDLLSKKRKLLDTEKIFSTLEYADKDVVKELSVQATLK